MVLRVGFPPAGLCGNDGIPRFSLIRQGGVAAQRAGALRPGEVKHRVLLVWEGTPADVAEVEAAVEAADVVAPAVIDNSHAAARAASHNDVVHHVQQRLGQVSPQPLLVRVTARRGDIGSLAALPLEERLADDAGRVGGAVAVHAAPAPAHRPAADEDSWEVAERMWAG